MKAANWVTGFLVVGTAAAILFSNQGGFILFGASWALVAVALLRTSNKDVIN